MYSAYDGDSSSSTSTSSGNSSTGGTSRSESFGSTSRTGTIIVPEGLGTERTYMGWQCITDTSSNQYKLREEAGMTFDDLGYGKIGDRYVVAMTSTYGNVGDYVDIYRSDGSVLHAIIGDIKNQNDAGANKWGNENGARIEEFVVDKNTWYSGNVGDHSNPGNEGNHPEWGGLSVVKVENLGNYWGRGGRGNSYLTNKLSKSNFKNPFNMKNKPNIIFGGRGLNNKTKIRQTQPSMIHPIVSKYSTFDPIVKPRVNYGGRGFTPIPTTSSVIDALSLKGSNSVMRTIDNAMQKPTTKSSNNTNATLSIDTSKLDKGNEISNSILTVLKSIAMTLERIERNSALSNNNNFNTIAYGENGELAAQSYKAVMMNNIIAGN